MSNVDPISKMTILERFKAVAISEQLEKNSPEYRIRRREFLAENVLSGFATNFGTNEHDLDSWKSLLRTIDVEGSDGFTSIKQCQKALNGKFINIVDLVDAANAEMTIRPPNPFHSEKALRDYIFETGKIFPKDEAKANPLLSRFLIEVFNRSRRRR